jgi:hypothetical protein
MLKWMNAPETNWEEYRRQLEELDLKAITDEGSRRAILLVLNLVEELKLENRHLREENQRLREEIQRLKGEQGPPRLPPNPSLSGTTTASHSSEKERHQPKERHKRSKLEQIEVTREEVLAVDPTQLPPDAEFKGYETTVVQDVKIEIDNVRFLKEKYYSPAEGKTYLAPLPAGYQGTYGPGVKALALVFYYASNMSQPKIVDWFAHVGIQLSAGALSQWLSQAPEPFQREKAAVYEAGLRSSPWQHLDETGTRVNGQNQQCHIVCNPLYTAYFTTEKKDRLSIVDVLRGLRPRTFRFNAEAYQWLQPAGLSPSLLGGLRSLPPDQDLSEAQVTEWLERHLPRLGQPQRHQILQAGAIAAYHAEVGFPVVRLLLCDDASQFKGVTEELALCWIHEGRHYKQLEPLVPHHQQLLDGFLQRYWGFYGKLLHYRSQPTPVEAACLAEEFDQLFSTVTGYQVLDHRVALTQAKKEALLKVLTHPEIPLHNNPAELGARLRVRKRDVSFGPRTAKGKQAWDTFHTLVSTTKKLGVSFYQYVQDRVTGAHQVPSLAELIKEKAQALNLGASWDSS